MLALEGKKVDFAVADEFSAAKAVRTNENIKCVGKSSFTMDYYAVFYDNDELLEAFNKALKHFKDNGEIDKIKNAYLSGETYLPEYTESYKNGNLTLLTDASFKPFEYCEDDGEPKGIDIAIAQIVCSYLGYSLTVKNMAFDETFLALSSGEADFIMSGVTYTPERAAVYDYSESYASLYYDILALK